MSADLGRRILTDMIAGNLEQGYAVLETEDWDLAIDHFNQAIEQVKQLKDMVATTPKATQPLLDV